MRAVKIRVRMLLRQQSVLRMLLAAGGSIGRLRLVKLMFLVSSENRLPPHASYDFVPYLFGPHSFTLYHDWSRLTEQGLGEESSPEEFRLTMAGIIAAKRLDDRRLMAIDQIHERFHHMDTNSVIDHVYDRWRWFTINSERATKFQKPNRPEASSKIHTVGYQGISVDRLLNTLMKVGVGTLVDVRANPTARRYGFHRSTLDRLCNLVGIRYVHEPRLGVGKARRTQLSENSNYAQYMEEYRTGLNRQESAIERIGALIVETPAALMCFEADEQRCHRLPLARALSSRFGLEVERIKI